MLLDEILEKLREKNSYKVYTVSGTSYTNNLLYQYVCNIYDFLLLRNPNKTPVVVYGHKEIYMKATFLACSFAGMTYVPVDVSMPSYRVSQIVKELNPKLIIGSFESDDVENVSKEEIETIMDKKSMKEIDKIYLKPDDIYYIIFTSGSTGIPKGVKVTYRNIDSCVKWLKDITKIDKGVILNQASFSFDLSVADLYLSLVTESEHFILEKKIQSDFKELFNTLRCSNITLAVMTPSFADFLLLDKDFNENLLPNFREIIFCGERLLKSTIQKLYDRFNNIRLINCYGPTECTFAVTSIELLKDKVYQENVPVGRVKENVEIFIVDERGEKLNDGMIGEILIVGESVAKGYVNENEISSSGFIEHNGKKGYLTGDLGFIKNGMLYYKCRKDKQVKYKGYRIEISDIENNFYKLSYVEKVVVTYKFSQYGKVIRLFAFVKLKDNIIKDMLQIRSDVLKYIPEYMCPLIKIVNFFPLNSNGKCDEKKLLEEF